MCGIGVAVDLVGRGRAQPWARPLMRHRGPDGEGVVAIDERQTVLEHCRLAIIDPDNPEASQPFTDPSGRWTIVYNGEVFNFRELREGLERRGVRFRTASDTEVVLHSYLQHGHDAFSELRGMFALVIADHGTGVLVAARDHLGVKPLYWTLTDGLFVAASELRTILGHPHVRRDLDPHGVVQHLAFGHTAGDGTVIAGVSKLAPGHLLRVEGGRAQVAEFWDVLSADDPPQDAALEPELLALLDESVSAALVSDVPVSMMLSGGLDSAAIAALAVRHVDPRDLTAYSVSFGLPSDESPAAARLARDLGIRHREILLTRETLAAGFDAWAAGVDVPCGNPTWVAVAEIARAVHEDGGKVLLGGDGGDELFGGYSRWMKYLRFYDRAWSRTPGVVRRAGGAAAGPLLRGLAGDIARRARDGGDLFVGSRPFHDDDFARCLGPAGTAAAAAVHPEQAAVDLRRRFDERRPDGDYLTWISYLMLKFHLVEDFLSRLDKMGMSHSVEGRVPLLDPHLARWALRVPQRSKVPGYEQKALFRRTVEPLLPDYIVRRPKQGFCPPVADWASSLLTARPISDGPLVEQGLVAPDAIARLRRDGSVGASFALWTLGMLSLWCEQNL